MFCCYVLPILIYGLESGSLTQYLLKKSRLYRPILKIPWTAKITNIKVLKRIIKDIEILKMIKTRKLEYFDLLIQAGQGKLP